MLSVLRLYRVPAGQASSNTPKRPGTALIDYRFPNTAVSQDRSALLLVFQPRKRQVGERCGLIAEQPVIEDHPG